MRDNGGSDDGGDDVMMKMMLLVCSAQCAPGAVLSLFYILTWPTQALRTGLVRMYVSS